MYIYEATVILFPLGDHENDVLCCAASRDEVILVSARHLNEGVRCPINSANDRLPNVSLS